MNVTSTHYIWNFLFPVLVSCIQISGTLFLNNQNLCSISETDHISQPGKATGSNCHFMNLQKVMNPVQ